MAAIKAVIYLLKKHYHLRTEYRSHTFRESICLHFKFGKGQTEIFNRQKC